MSRVRNDRARDTCSIKSIRFSRNIILNRGQRERKKRSYSSLPRVCGSVSSKAFRGFVCNRLYTEVCNILGFFRGLGEYLGLKREEQTCEVRAGETRTGT